MPVPRYGTNEGCGQNGRVATLRIPIRVKPGASRTRVGGRYGDDQLIVAVNAPPVEGAANDAVVAAVADALGIRPRQIALISGHTARSKVLEVQVADEASATALATVADLLNGR